jgi:hypothetical protein
MNRAILLAILAAVLLFPAIKRYLNAQALASVLSIYPGVQMLDCDAYNAGTVIATDEPDDIRIEWKINPFVEPKLIIAHYTKRELQDLIVTGKFKQSWNVDNALYKEYLKRNIPYAGPAPTLRDLTPIGIIPSFEHPVWGKLLEDWNAHHAPQLANTDFGHAMVWPNTWLKGHDARQYDRACRIISTTPGLVVSDAIDTELGQ